MTLNAQTHINLSILIKILGGPLPSFLGIFTHFHLTRTYALPLINTNLPRTKIGQDVKGLNLGTWYLLSAFYGICGLCQLRSIRFLPRLDYRAKLRFISRWALSGTVDRLDDTLRWIVVLIYGWSAFAFYSLRGAREWRVWASVLSASTTMTY